MGLGWGDGDGSKEVAMLDKMKPRGKGESGNRVHGLASVNETGLSILTFLGMRHDFSLSHPVRSGLGLELPRSIP